MHFSSQSLLAMLSLLHFTSAMDPPNLNLGIFDKRQLLGTGNSASTTATPTTSSPSQTTQLTTSQTTPTTTDEPPTTTSPTTQQSQPPTTSPTTQSPASTSANPTTSSTDASPPTTSTGRSTSPTTAASTKTNTQGTSTARSTVAGSAGKSSTATSLTTITSALVASSTQAFTTTMVTVIDGSTSSFVTTSNRVVETTTGYATYTTAPALVGNSNNSGSGGLSTRSKSLIGGLVGGLGGAILLGGIGIVLWRIYGRKRRHADDEDDDMLPGDLREKRGSPVGQPFTSTLDSYHTPGQKPSTAANF